MERCTFTLDTDAVAGGTDDGGGEWACPHEAHPDAKRCVFHLSTDRREELGVTDDDVTDRLLDLFSAVDPEKKQALGATLPAIHLEYRDLGSESRNVVDCRYSDIEALELDHTTVEVPLDLSGATVDRLDLTEAEFEKRVFLSDVTVTGDTTADDTQFHEEVEAEGCAFEGDITFTGAEFDDEILLDDAVFEGELTFAGAELHGRSNVRGDNTSFAGADFHAPATFTEALFEYSDFQGAHFQEEVTFESTRFDGEVAFDDVVFESTVEFVGARFLNNATFKRTEYHGTADFRGVEFTGGANIREDDADFEESVFHGPARFGDAVFTFADFTDVVFEDEADFERARFTESTTFDDAVFEGLADFDERRFEKDATFRQTTYHATADFRGAEFYGGANVLEDDADFEKSVFHGPARFGDAVFAYSDFHEVVFEDEADFEGARFGEDTSFDDVVFHGLADFDEGRFAEDASFKRTEYRDTADFRGVEFQGGANVLEDDADFEESVFHGPARFGEAEFAYSDFHDVVFEDEALFEGVAFDEDADFHGCEFDALADFDEARFRADGDFSGAVFAAEADFRGVVFLGESRYLEDNARFEDAVFQDYASFDEAVFTSANFKHVAFAAEVDFQDAVFRDSLDMAALSAEGTTYVNMTDADIAEGSIAQPEDHWVRYDLTRAHIGDISLSGDDGSHQLFDYFRFLETDFDGFDFSEHRGYLDRNDWELHVFEEADADYDFAVEATPAAIETTYLYAYNNAKAMGDNDAAIEFAIHQATFRRQKNVGYVSDGSQSLGYRLGKLGDVIGNTLWYATCGYGYRLWRILAVSVFVIVSWGFMYALPFTTLDNEASLASYGALFSADGLNTVAQYVYYSLITFTTVGYGDINPVNAAARTLAVSEGILGVLLAALVVFVLGRRVAV